jgi:hypothetical protein
MSELGIRKGQSQARMQAQQKCKIVSEYLAKRRNNDGSNSNPIDLRLRRVWQWVKIGILS